jgi:Zn-dependent M28 family amino/carboxypeptidase
MLTACAATPAPKPASSGSELAHSRWYGDVAGMAQAEDNAGRRAHLQTRLQGIGLTATKQAFVAGKLEGENLLVDLDGPAGAPLLLIGAHSDRVDAGRGATDNASGSAVVLALAERLQRTPLAHHRVKVAFWDLEEHGLLGAAAYIEQSGEQKSEKPALYINFDVFGWGDSLWMMTPDQGHPLVAASRGAAEAQGLAISAGKQYPPSDHLAFLKADWPAVSYSLVGADEIPGILATFAGKRPMSPPKVMKVIHSPNDTVDQVDEAAAAKGIDAVEDAIRAWDAQSK